MLVLTRKRKQSIMIGHDVKVTVLAIQGEKVRLGVEAPTDLPVHRAEIYLEIEREHEGQSEPTRESPGGDAPGALGESREHG